MLLDSGSTPITRKAAAEQIGEVQKLHPHELNNLLRKVNTIFRVFLTLFMVLIRYDMNIKKKIAALVKIQNGYGNS